MILSTAPKSVYVQSLKVLEFFDEQTPRRFCCLHVFAGYGFKTEDVKLFFCQLA